MINLIFFTPPLFRFLANVNPRTEIPTVATIVSGVFSAILAFIFNLHDLVEMMSIGTLLAYTMVALCVLILRYTPGTIGLIKANNSDDSLVSYPCNSKETSRQDLPLLGKRLPREPSEATVFLAQTAIIISCISFAALSALIIWGSHYISQTEWWAILLLTLIMLSLIICTLLLLWLPQNKTPLPFMVPGVPVLPLVSVFINVFLILKLSYLTWIRFGVWMVTGEYNFVGTLLIWSVEFRYNDDIF